MPTPARLSHAGHHCAVVLVTAVLTGVPATTAVGQSPTAPMLVGSQTAFLDALAALGGPTGLVTFDGVTSTVRVVPTVGTPGMSVAGVTLHGVGDGPGAAAVITAERTNIGGTVTADCSNGSWIPTRPPGPGGPGGGPFAAVASGGALRVTFGTPVAGVGAVLNYTPPCLYGTPVPPGPSIRLLGAAGEVLGTYNLEALAPITTPAAVNAGAFRGAIRPGGDIYAAEFASGTFLVLDDLRFGGVAAGPPVTSVPEPATVALVAIGWCGIVVGRRRRRTGRHANHPPRRPRPGSAAVPSAMWAAGWTALAGLATAPAGLSGQAVSEASSRGTMAGARSAAPVVVAGSALRVLRAAVDGPPSAPPVPPDTSLTQSGQPCGAARACAAGWDLRPVLVATDSVAPAGGSLRTRVVIENAGRVAAPPSEVQLCVDLYGRAAYGAARCPGIAGSALRVALPALGPGERVAFTRDLRMAPLTTAVNLPFAAVAVIDPERMTDEPHRANNGAGGGAVRGELPALTVAGLDPAPETQGVAALRRPLVVELRVRNDGRAASTPPTEVELRSDEGRSVGNLQVCGHYGDPTTRLTVPPLAPGQRFTARIEITHPAATCTASEFLLMARVDPDLSAPWALAQTRDTRRPYTVR
ncbi:PEP-CTERM sorting domain-containing protein [Roseisolibacter agri]|uniref:PEP-CTERM protein-sorting domain-containing protein n=1 Tax=Roseisolibacter agri TaxID=2014610 RepID=A0AA37QKN3_9BACT|nr:PEP-CTERM sorting domain-containing protein [Roseisolibacter agri]GLC28305.1 hypothetical protein rosag_48180 [Roseisolibacter agri]